MEILKKSLKFLPKYEIGETIFYWDNEKEFVKSAVIEGMHYYIEKDNNVSFRYFLDNGEKKWEGESTFEKDF